MFIGGR